MKIVVNLDVMMARRKISLNALSERVGISVTNLSLLKTGKVRGVRMEAISPLTDFSFDFHDLRLAPVETDEAKKS